MGLDITAYKGLKKLDCVHDADGEPIDPVTRQCIDYDARAYVNHDYPTRADDIEHQAAYSAEASMHIGCGAYSRYNRWRDELAKLAGWPLGSYEQYGRAWESYAASAWVATEGPFWEMISFSDCEGVIGPLTSAKLAKDFAEFDERAKVVGGYFYDQYQRWRAAFEMAAENGMVCFH